MLAYKTRPKLKKYLALDILSSTKKVKERKKNTRGFFPRFNLFFSKSPIRRKEQFSNLLSNRRKLKLRYGFHKTNSLQKILDKDLKKKMNSHRILKALEFCSLLERRLDVIMLRLGLVSTIFESKHLISHKKVYMNGKFISRSAHLLKKGDIISLDPSIHFKIKKQLRKQLTIRSFHFTQHSDIEINWKCLKFILIREKISFFKQTPLYFFFLNWQSLANEELTQ
jgi:ribosomal protein S4